MSESRILSLLLDDEAEQVTDQPLDVGNLIVSPDGKSIAFTMEVFPDCRTVDETVERLDTIPMVCVRILPDSVFDMRQVSMVQLTGDSVLTLFMTNQYGAIHYNTHGWYRISVSP